MTFRQSLKSVPLLSIVCVLFLFGGNLLFTTGVDFGPDGGIVKASEGTESEGTTDATPDSSSGEDADSSEWISLFDGQTLGCWEDGEEAGSIKPEVKDGCLVIGMGAMSSGVRYNEEKAGTPFPKSNYEIEYVAKRQLGNDFFAAMTFPFGDSACTLINGGWGGTLFGVSSVDKMDASENNYSSYYGFKNKVWYIFRIRVTDRTITAWLDDEEMLKVFTDKHQIGVRIEMSRYQPLGIASWVSEGWVRSIRYRLLDQEEIDELNNEADQHARSKMSLKL